MDKGPIMSISTSLLEEMKSKKQNIPQDLIGIDLDKIGEAIKNNLTEAEDCVIHHPAGSPYYYLVKMADSKLDAGSSGKVLKAYRIDQLDPIKFFAEPIILKNTFSPDPSVAVEEFKNEVDLFKKCYKTPEGYYIEQKKVKRKFDEESQSDKLVEEKEFKEGFIFTPFLPGKPIYNQVQDLSKDKIQYNFDRSTLSIEQKNNLSKQIAEWLFIMHTNLPGRGLSFLHGDIASSNWHFDIDEKGVRPPAVRPLDFGTAKRVESLRKLVDSKTIGTFGYLTPESLEGKQAIASDYWSISPILACLYGANNPFKEKMLAPAQRRLTKESEKYTFHVLTSEENLESTIKGIKVNGVVVFKDKAGDYYAALKKDGAQFMHDPIEVVSEIKDQKFSDKFVISLNKGEPQIFYYNEKGEQNELKNDFLKPYLTNLPTSITNNIAGIQKELRKNKEARDLTKAVFKINITEEELKNSKQNELVVKIWKEAGGLSQFQQSFLEDRKAEVEAKLNLNGFLEEKEAEWFKPYYLQFINKMQTIDYAKRPTPLENLMFHGILDYSKNMHPNKRPDCSDALNALSTTGFKPAGDNYWPQYFEKIAMHFFTKMYSHYEFSAEQSKNINDFYKLSIEFFSCYEHNPERLPEIMKEIVNLTADNPKDRIDVLKLIAAKESKDENDIYFRNIVFNARLSKNTEQLDQFWLAALEFISSHDKQQSLAKLAIFGNPALFNQLNINFESGLNCKKIIESFNSKDTEAFIVEMQSSFTRKAPDLEKKLTLQDTLNIDKVLFSTKQTLLKKLSKAHELEKKQEILHKQRNLEIIEAAYLKVKQGGQVDLFKEIVDEMAKKVKEGGYLQHTGKLGFFTKKKTTWSLLESIQKKIHQYEKLEAKEQAKSSSSKKFGRSGSESD